MNTALYAAMHFGVDLICAWSMFRSIRLGSAGYEDFLIYNFCAFALQMPLGTLLDIFQDRKGKIPCLWAAGGAAVTVLGALVHPAVLGIGNALFHVGGGMDVIGTDFENGRKGRELGIFVAPGAAGLYVGTLLGKKQDSLMLLLTAAAVLTLLTVPLLSGKRQERKDISAPADDKRSLAFLCLCCFSVVVLRSWIGLSVTFPWKSGALWSAAAVAAVVLGKASGGFLAAKLGLSRTITFSLLLAAVCFLLGEHLIFGLAALLLFNMSMPVTLYLLASRLPRLPGFSFGLLTFGLFLGFLPVYAGFELPVSGSILGAAGSVISALLLLFGGRAVTRHGIPA